MDDEDGSHRQLAVRVAEAIPPEQRPVLRAWISDLLAIRDSNRSAAGKAREAIRLTLSSKVVWPAVKIVATEVKRLGWDDRTSTARLGLAGAAVGVALFGSGTAGLAALGTAIAVPLWVVVGAGAAFAGVLLDELTRAHKKDD